MHRSVARKNNVDDTVADSLEEAMEQGSSQKGTPIQPGDEETESVYDVVDTLADNATESVGDKDTVEMEPGGTLFATRCGIEALFCSRK